MSASPQVDQRKAGLRVLQVFQQMVAPCFFGEQYLPGLASLPADAQTAFKNAILDGSLVAIRAFNEFLGNRKLPDDLNQIDFGGFVAAPQFLSQADKTALHKTVAHLSKSYLDTEQPFPLKKYLLAALPVMISFCQFLETSQLGFSPQEMNYVSDSRTIFQKIETDLKKPPINPANP
jgi:hypothetical protein